jgi:hypothetical protein
MLSLRILVQYSVTDALLEAELVDQGYTNPTARKRILLGVQRRVFIGLAKHQFHSDYPRGKSAVAQMVDSGTSCGGFGALDNCAQCTVKLGTFNRDPALEDLVDNATVLLEAASRG